MDECRVEALAVGSDVSLFFSHVMEITNSVVMGDEVGAGAER